MAKISIIERHPHLRLIVEGDLVGPWAAELKSACEKANVDLRDRELVLDIRHLTAISQEGENVLLQLMRNGTKFRGSGVFTKHVLRQLSGRAATPSGRITITESNVEIAPSPRAVGSPR